MSPFRFADAVFNPQHVVNVHKETRQVRLKTAYFVVIVSTFGEPVSLRTIDPLEQEGTLQDFLTAWRLALSL